MIKRFFIFPVLYIFLFSCNNSPERVTEKEIIINKKETVSQDSISKTIASIGIEGMTCQAGCARNIQNKVSKLTGVISCEVSFENKIATVEFDDSKISEKEMISAIQKIREGQYSVASVRVEKFVVK